MLIYSCLFAKTIQIPWCLGSECPMETLTIICLIWKPSVFSPNLLLPLLVILLSYQPVDWSLLRNVYILLKRKIILPPKFWCLCPNWGVTLIHLNNHTVLLPFYYFALSFSAPLNLSLFTIVILLIYLLFRSLQIITHSKMFSITFCPCVRLLTWPIMIWFKVIHY